MLQRWNHHLRPDIKKEAWTAEEEAQLVEAHKELGNKWSDIARLLPGAVGSAKMLMQASNECRQKGYQLSDGQGAYDDWVSPSMAK